MSKNALNRQKIYVAGHRGMVGSAIVRRLRDVGYEHILTKERGQLDLLDQEAVRRFMSDERPDRVVLAAAKVGGIYANNEYPAEFIYQNLAIQTNTINAAHRADVQHLLFLGSSCIYPRLADQPIREESLLGGPLEPTNESYAMAKIAGIKMCESYNREYGRDYRSVMPTNLFGPGDNFHPKNSHVVPALIRRMHEAKRNSLPEVTVWGSGKPFREFMHVDDLASACVHIMELTPEQYWKNAQPRCSHINVGTGRECSIAYLATVIKDVVGYKGRITFDASKPDGSPRKLLDVARLRSLGWAAQIPLRKGVEEAYDWYLSQVESVDGNG